MPGGNGVVDPLLRMLDCQPAVLTNENWLMFKLTNHLLLWARKNMAAFECKWILILEIKTYNRQQLCDRYYRICMWTFLVKYPKFTCAINNSYVNLFFTWRIFPLRMNWNILNFEHTLFQRKKFFAVFIIMLGQVDSGDWARAREIIKKPNRSAYCPPACFPIIPCSPV